MAEGERLIVTQPQNSERSRWKREFLKVFRNKLAYIGITGCLIIIIISIFAPLIAPYDPTSQKMTNRFAGPSTEHFLGTDQFGRDYFSRIVYATRVSFFISVASITISLLVGTAIGILAGYKGGWIDVVVGEFTNIFLAFPTIVLGILILVAIGSGVGNVIISLSIAFSPRFIRLARASTISVKEQTFIEAARAGGLSDMTIIVKHILPNVISTSIVSAALWTATAIRAESALSFLGLGVQPPNSSWGNMISDALLYILESPSLTLFPALAITIAVLSLNMFGDALRDYLDPRIQY